MKELKDTADMMNSPDYKERFKAEYYQLEARIAKLDKMLEKWVVGALEFEPTCSFELLNRQLGAMKTYSMCLKERAEIEGVEL